MTEPATYVPCPIGDPAFVETRFGVLDCGVTPNGAARCSQAVPPWARDARGRAMAGPLMVLADHVLGELPYVRRPAGTWSLTTELTLDVVGDLTHVTTLAAEARDVAPGGDTFVTCRIVDDAGAVVAVGSTRCTYSSATTSEPAPAPLPITTFADATDIDAFLGLSRRTEAGETRVTLAEPGSWANDYGILHGGVSACVSALAAEQAIGNPGTDLVTTRVHTTYLRPVPAGAPFVAIARPSHVGRSVAVVEVIGHGGAGQPCTVSTVTARRTGTRQARP